jgi:ssDNA-binding Zn-finger/Zn-ribbon topoisomerase 1
MHNSQLATPSHKPIARRPCPRCGWDMSVTSMNRDKRNPSQRRFECPTCEHFEGTARDLEVKALRS